MTLSPFQDLSKPRPRMVRCDRHIDTIVIGAGHAGLAISAQLSQRQVEHVVLEAGEVGQRWRYERWHSLKLLTPNWSLKLPQMPYDGDRPDEFMHKDALADYLENYVRVVNAPVKRSTKVHSVVRAADGYRVTTTQGEWFCRALVLATGAYAKANVPKLAEMVPQSVHQSTARDYKCPSDLPAGKVLVVGGSATGLQLAQELNAAGREVILSVGEHVRMPRQVAGRDVYRWLMESGVFWESADEIDDLNRARRLPSPQLVGEAGPDLNLNALQDAGIEIVGRFGGVSDRCAQFSGNLPHLCKSADLKMQRLLKRFAESSSEGLGEEALYVPPTEITRPRLKAGLGDEVQVVLWATGFKPDYSWLEVDTFDHKGRLRHDGGVVAAPGLYALGLPMMRSRASTFIAGTEPDSRAIANHLRDFLETCSQPIALSS